MAEKIRSAALVPGSARHRRTESEYVATMLEEVTLEDWREVISNAKERAKAGDVQARAWLGQYLMGRPSTEAPAPLTVVVNQLSGADPLVEKLADPLIEQRKYPLLHADDEWQRTVRDRVASELASKVIPAPDVANLPDDFGKS
jgi:hypothetical protein